jgi:hypothetical protein
MKTIATINFKGGVGKTTCTWGLPSVDNSPSTLDTLYSPHSPDDGLICATLAPIQI